MIKYRILSFDGGGIRGLLTSTLLSRIEKQVPNLIHKTDLFAGTSSGGLIALGLAGGMSPDDLSNLYQNSGPAIFDNSWIDNIKDLGGLSGATYETRISKKSYPVSSVIKSCPI